MKAHGFFSPPVFPDEDLTRRVRVLHIFLLASALAVTVVEVANIFLLPQNAFRWVALIVCFNACSFVLLKLNQRGRTRLVSFLLVAECWLIITLLLVNGGGVHSPATQVYLLIVFGAGLFFGLRAGILVGILSCGTTLVFVILENRGLFPEAVVHDTTWSLWGEQILYTTLMICLQFLATSAIERALERARRELAERERAEKSLFESEKVYRLVVEQSGQIVYDYDVATDAIMWRGAIVHLTGYTVEEFRHIDIHRWAGLIHPEDRPRTIALFEEAMRRAGTFQAEYRFRTKNGTYIYIEDNGIFLTDASGKPTRMLGTKADITARKVAEARNRELTRGLEKRVRDRTAELETANKDLEAFSYSVSHDLRAPLRAIEGYSNIVLEDYREGIPVEAGRLLESIRSNTGRMNRLITDLLTFFRLNRQALNKTMVDMQAMASDIAEELRSEAKDRQIEIKTTSLPKAFGDPALLTQVFVNLLGNAVKFTRGRTVAEILVSSMEQDHDIIYFVRDNGNGFDMEHANKLFLPFERLHSEKEFEGTGIGLSIVQRIIQHHGGRVWAEGMIGKGATFYFSLPNQPPSPS